MNIYIYIYEDTQFNLNISKLFNLQESISWLALTRPALKRML